MNPTGSKSIICYDVPEVLLHKTIAKKYFKSFGPLIKIIVKPKSKKCIVEYETVEAAEEAYSLAGDYEDGIEFRIEFQVNPTTSKRKPKKVKEIDPDWNLDPDVQEELNAMGYIPVKQHNLRPEKMVIEENLSLKKESRESRKAKRQGDINKVRKVESDLRQIIKQRAFTTEEKYKVLDARDKLIRMRQNRNVNLHKMGITVGTCPDMCSEKERLMREVQHQVALYEQEIGERTMNHSIAVKQYSRSSADQEMPLPHELRNVDVLQMTMGYLMHKIMHLCDTPDVNLGEWFHFLWDRMRGIRKDITQQELCCQGSVNLVEQCARFHIHCSARLVAEDPSVFDQKINTENLTKCLQTLKYMYHDLAVKGERCPNEAEFRAYVILLNLNDGNFMWEVQQLQTEIQHSPEIKFALQVYSSLDKNNFVKFFKLVQSTTYLNACILLRYFIQVRTKALRTIVQCYTPRLPHAHFPIERLTHMLAFEGRASTIDFLQYFGLSISPDGLNVVLNKKNFSLPDLPYTLDRAVNVIESKRIHSVGEVVCGDTLPLPIFETHQIQNSFIDGYLDLTTLDFGVESEQIDEVDRVDIFRSKDRSASPMNSENNSKEAWPMKTQQHSEQSSVKVSKSTDGSGVFSFALKQATHSLSEQQRQHELQSQLQKEREKFAAEQRKLQEKLEQKRKEMEIKLRQQQEEQRKQLEEVRLREEQRRMESQRLQEEIRRKQEIEENLRRMELRRIQEKQKIEAEIKFRQEQERKRKIQEEIRREEETKRRLIEADRRLAEEKEKLCEIRTSVHQLVQDLLDSVEETYQRERLEELRRNTLGRIFFTKWRKKVSVNSRKRKAIDQCPFWMSQTNINDLAREFYTPSQNLTLNLMKRYKRGVPINCKVPKLLPIKPLDLNPLTSEELIRNSLKSKRLQNNIFWKVGIYFNEDKKSIADFLDNFIKWDNSKVLLQQVTHGLNKLTYCVHKTPLEGDNDNINGLIIIATQLTEELIDNLLQYLNKLGDLELLPVAFILHERCSKLEEEINILHQNKMISEKIIIESTFAQDHLAYCIEEGLIFLAKNHRLSTGLLLNTLKGFLNENLGELFQRMRSFAKWHLPYKKCIAKPQVAIGLYNSALEKLENIIFNTQRLEYPQFPKIFQEFLSNEIPDYLPCDFKYFPLFWKQKEYENILRFTLQHFKLPEYTGMWSFNETNQFKIEQSLLDYCQNIFENPQKVFYKVMSKVLKIQDENSSDSCSWIDIVEVLMEEKLKLVDFTLPDAFRTQTIFNQLVVIYQQLDLHSYGNDSWFYLKHPLVEQEIDLEDESKNESFVDQESIFEVEDDHDFNEKLNVDLDCKLEELLHRDSSKTAKCKEALDDFQRLLDDLEESLTIQKEISKKFGSHLKSYLEEG